MRRLSSLVTALPLLVSSRLPRVFRLPGNQPSEGAEAYSFRPGRGVDGSRCCDGIADAREEGSARHNLTTGAKPWTEEVAMLPRVVRTRAGLRGHTTTGLVACCLLVLAPAIMTGSAPATAQPLGGEWPSLTMDAQNSRYQAQSTITSSNVAQIRQQWMIQTSAPVTSTPVVLDGNAYFADWAGNLYSAQVATGNLNWVVNLGHPISSTPTLANGLVYVGLSPLDTLLVGPTFQENVLAISPADGHTVWETRLDGTMHGLWASPTVSGDMLYIGLAGSIGQQDETNPSDLGQMYALNAMTGTTVWSRTLAGTAGGAGVWGSVVADPGLNSVYFGTGNSYSTAGTIGAAYSIISLDAATGATRWQYRVYRSHKSGRDYDFGSTPNLFSLKFHLNGGTKDAIGIGNKNGSYYIVNEQTGRLLRKFNVMRRGGVVGLAAVVPGANGDPEIFVPTYKAANDISDPSVCCGGIVALDPVHHAVTWRSRARANVIGSVAAVPGAILFGDAIGDLYAVSSSSGKVLFQKQLPGPIEAGVTVAEGHVLVPTGAPFYSQYTNGVYAFAP